MRILRDNDPLADDAHDAIWAVGNFDGLHRGHQALFARARALATERRVLAGVLTFAPHPAKVLNAALAPPLILTEAEKEEGIAAAGIDILVVLPFDASLAALAAGEFVRRVLVERLHVGGVVVGEGFRFGFRAGGEVADLRAALPLVDVVPPVKEGDFVCSSTKIRELVLEGRVDIAARLLGRPYSLSGEVVHGDARGRTIGIPTANIRMERELVPKVGVYASRAVLEDGSVHRSVTNIGLRPTFAGTGVRIEAHVLDGFAGDLYGRRLKLELVRHLRDESRFPNVDALVAQIHQDIAAAKAVLSP